MAAIDVVRNAAIQARSYRPPHARFFLPLLLFLALLGRTTATRADTPQSPEQIEFFEEHVRPILVEHCVKCHGQDKQRGGLRLDSREALLTGGESGPAVELEVPEESLLLSAINYDSLEMPPTGKLDDRSIAVLTEWVRSGAVWPNSGESGPQIRARDATIGDEDRAYWAFQPLADVGPPAVDDSWARTAVDAFILERLRAAGLEPAPVADRVALVRRAYFDLWGLPPTAREVDAFVNDPRPEAFSELVNRLLDHPNYGRRWARHWLDLVRYAESDGYKQDSFRPAAWRYRDYVIRSFNEDKPYDQFVIEQLAGDEIAPHDLNARVATGFLRHTIYEYNQRDVRSQWDLMINELTDVTADVFLGIGLSCARCHDHKFDPFLQQDYFRLRAFLEPVLPRDDLPFATREEISAYEEQLQIWKVRTASIRRELDQIEGPIRERVAAAAINKFPLDVRPLLRKRPDERLPGEHQIAELANRQTLLELENLNIATHLSGDDQQRWQRLRAELGAFDYLKPEPLPQSFCATDVGPTAPVTAIPSANPLPIEPGFLSVLVSDSQPASIATPAASHSTGRRTTLARWIASPDNPLSTRVIVNRVWQYHFGTGLVASSSDFGRLGEPPSHPELLDWLTREFINNGWSLKHLHRVIMNSATYQQSSLATNHEWAQTVDPNNRLLWHMPTRRLDAEQIRDALLAASGDLRERAGGPSDPPAEPVRSIYTRIMRNARDPLLEAFDAPDAFGSLAQRNVTTTPTQSLLMINSSMTLSRAEALGELAYKQQQSSEDVTAGIQWVYRRTLGRHAEPDEVELVRSFLEQQTRALAKPGNDYGEMQKAERAAWTDLCHVLLNSSEFLYVE